MFLRITIVSRVCGSPLFDWLSPEIDTYLTLSDDQKRCVSMAALIGLFNQFARDLGGTSINQVKFSIPIEDQSNQSNNNHHVPRSSTPQPHSNGSFSQALNQSINQPIKRGNPRAYPRYGLNYHRTLPPVKRSVNNGHETELSSLFTNQSTSHSNAPQFSMVFASSDDLLLAAIPDLSEHDQSIKQASKQSVYESADRILVTFQTAYHAHLAALKSSFLHDAKNSEDAINDEKYMHDPHPFTQFKPTINQSIKSNTTQFNQSISLNATTDNVQITIS